MSDAEENFLQSDCILSHLSTTREGYAQIKVKGKMRSHHRVIWEQVNGPIPEGLKVLHHCDVRNCINVEHLFLGTSKDNAQDMIRKGRGRNQLKTHCTWGHEFTKENTHLTTQGARRCRECSRIQQW